MHRRHARGCREGCCHVLAGARLPRRTSLPSVTRSCFMPSALLVLARARLLLRTCLSNSSHPGEKRPSWASSKPPARHVLACAPSSNLRVASRHRPLRNHFHICNEHETASNGPRWLEVAKAPTTRSNAQDLVAVLNSCPASKRAHANSAQPGGANASVGNQR